MFFMFTFIFVAAIKCVRKIANDQCFHFSFKKTNYTSKLLGSVFCFYMVLQYDYGSVFFVAALYKCAFGQCDLFSYHYIISIKPSSNTLKHSLAYSLRMQNLWPKSTTIVTTPLEMSVQF